MKCCQMSDAQFLLNITLKRKYAKGDFQNTIQMRKKRRKMYAGIDGISHSGKTEVWFEFRPGITSSQNIEKGATQLLVS